ncbi:MAG: hypothetical protein GY866_32145 [Proteobacteria bacterium]|nr:hypothetical protein [Pseudomonadota bacterium]
MADPKEIYEKLRVLLSPKGFAQLPQHELTDKLLTNLYSEEEANLVVTCFKEFREKVSFDKIKELSDIPEKELTDMLAEMLQKGKMRFGGAFTDILQDGKIRFEGISEFFMLAYLPGVFEDYFTIDRDDKQKMKLVAEAHRALQKMGFSPHIDFPLKSTPDFSNEAGWRFVPAIEPVTKTLDIDENIETEHQILPFEILGDYLGGYDTFSVVKCSCRNMAELAGEPCQRTNENFCLSAGPGAQASIDAGIGKKLNYDETMALLKRAAEAGLVHSTMNMQAPSSFI